MKNAQNTQPVIVITGAGKGIGEAIVQEIIHRKEQFKNFGGLPRLVLTSRTESELLKLKSLSNQSNLECEILPMDLTSNPSKPIESAVDRFGEVTFLIHSAGVGSFKPFLEQTREDLNHTMNTNVFGSFYIMQKAYSEMKKQGHGHIVFITSVASEKPFVNSSSYCMSKFAQRGLIEVMRLTAYQDGIKITEVKPGAVLTPMWGEVTPEMTKRMMTPKQVAQGIVDAILIPGVTTVEELTLRPISGDV